jgi:CubicO group peptidase (beta-lactamase class C family)
MADVASTRPVDPFTQYRIGSITKTFTATAVLLLAHAGRVDLDDPVERYLPGTPLGRARLRQLLAHNGGVQREAPHPLWSTMHGPDDEELRAALDHAEMIDDPGVRWHYSNLGYAMLGQIVAVVTGAPCQEFIDANLIGPLGLHATTWQSTETAATGYRLDRYTDAVHIEPVMDQGAVGVGGQLWSTGEDLIVWADALTGGRPHVVPDAVVSAMHTLHVMTDVDGWTQGWGLGLILDRRDRGILSGHTGAMPGFLAALSMHRSTRTAVAAFTNVTRGIRLASLTAELLEAALDSLDAEPQAAVVSAKPPASAPSELDGVLGRWWCEAEETIFTWREGTLRAHLVDAPATTETTFTVEGPDRYRAAAGRLQGERLIVKRDGHGNVAELDWATYPYTRTPR